MDYRKQLDYSSLSTYLTCPRKFLFQYVLHLRGRRPSIDLVFGSCWHYGLEVAYNRLKDDPENVPTPIELTRISVAAFNALWTIEGEPHFDPASIFPKSPGHAAEMFKAYWTRFHALDLDTYSILAVEHPFSLDLSAFGDKLPAYIGRMDLVMEDLNKSLIIIDHKTAKYNTKATFVGYESSLQTDGYLTIGHMYYDRIPTMLYNVAICQAKKIDFERFPIVKAKSTIEHFLSNLVHYSREIIHNLELFDEDCKTLTKRTDCTRCFPRRPGLACTAFFRPCSHYELCRQRNNPLLWVDRPPAGYVKHEWNPATHEAETRKKLGENK